MGALFMSLTLLSSCAGVADLRSGQVSITEPRELQRVLLPFDVSWTTHHLPQSTAGYAVFVDRLPMAPGADVRALVDSGCRQRVGCPDTQYLHNLGVYLTARSRVAIPALQTLGGLRSRTDEPVHTVIVVPLDKKGHRIGGLAGSADFAFER